MMASGLKPKFFDFSSGIGLKVALNGEIAQLELTFECRKVETSFSFSLSHPFVRIWISLFHHFVRIGTKSCGQFR
jgi:hypothetical protein